MSERERAYKKEDRNWNLSFKLGGKKERRKELNDAKRTKIK